MTRHFAIILVVIAVAAQAQGPSEPSRTIVTPHFRVHYPVRYEAWSRRAAARLEAVREAVVREVGFAPEEITDVVIGNPVAEANGSTLPLLDTPRIVLFAEPPEPEMQIGEYPDWIDLLEVHEMTHLVHLLRPSRNPMQRALGHIVPFDPITFSGPRWVLEGYATVIEGRLTGSGRPSSSMRAAVLRKWAVSGQLPSYSQLNSDHRFLGMSMAYLAGSAFLEWLEARGGPDSLRHLWARMTARERRGFDQAFEGVFGDSPQRLYGQFAAELTASAMTIARTEHFREGDLWQETSHGSGDPAVSPDGQQLAMVLRDEHGSARLVVYSTGVNEEDEKQAKRIEKMLKRDPEDVAPVRTKPLRRKPLFTLTPRDGGDIVSPRWTRDGKAIVYTHKQPDGDGFLHHDLSRWVPSTGQCQRITHLADVKDADPLPDGRAIAVRSRYGTSQLVFVNLLTGEVTAMNEPSLDTVYSHPRGCIDGRLTWAEHSGGEWHVVVDGKRLPVAGAFSPEWGPNGSLFASVATHGFIEIALLSGPNAGAPITHTSGAAFDAAPSPDGSLYFMSLEPQGFVVRRLADTNPAEPRTAAFDASLVPALPPQPATPVVFRNEPLLSERPYGVGRQEPATIFGGQYTAFGRTTEVGLRLGDVAGRLDTLILGALGSETMPRGGALATTWRGWPVAASAHIFHTRDSRGVELRGSWERSMPGSKLSLSGGALLEKERRPLDSHQSRVFLDAQFTTRQRRIAREELSITADSAHHVQASAHGAVRLGDLSVGAALTEGRRVKAGGTASSIEPDSLLIARILDPALERSAFATQRYHGERLELGMSGVTAFWQRHHLDRDVDEVGLEVRISEPPDPLVKLPALQVTAGVARVRVDGKTRAWLALRWKP